LQYEATQPVDSQIVLNVVSKIAEYVSPFPVIAFDLGTFGIGLILRDLAPTGSGHGSSIESPARCGGLDGSSLNESSTPLNETSEPSQDGYDENMNNPDNTTNTVSTIIDEMSAMVSIPDRMSDLGELASNISELIETCGGSDTSCMIFSVVELKLI
jgi:hypothetical protein